MGAALQSVLERNHALAERTREKDFPLEAFEELQQWQRHRLRRTYADLLAEPQYSAAGHFFLEELYGGLEFRERDQEVARVLPVMSRMLPGHMLSVLVRAFELQALSLELDIDMASRLAESGGSLDATRYADIYRATGRIADRERQLELIGELGHELNGLVRHRLVLALIRLMRAPARAAGFGRLQDFLEQGLDAFRTMKAGDRFVDTICRREAQALEKLTRGDESPFAA